MTQEIRRDNLTPALAARFAATFDRPAPNNVAPDDTAPGTSVPQGLHWCLCTPEEATLHLGPDGHPARGKSILPESPLPRRMWAASSVVFLTPLKIGAAIERRSNVVDAVEKTGESGTLLFVTVAHEVLADGLTAVRETQTIVYRQPAVPSTRAVPPVVAPAQDWPWQRTITPGSVLLLRYSALTFNSHRIHYDLPYARDIEGYSGLVVHGPLMATLLLDLCEREAGTNCLAQFAFRAQTPAFVDEPLKVVGRPEGNTLALAVLGANGRTVMAATAMLAPG
jgi:3-methylfumaryl-CoA hydratase